MNLANRSGCSLVVAVAVSSLLGCGSSTDRIGWPTTVDSPFPERSTTKPSASLDLSATASASQTKLQEPISALETANASKKTLSQDPNTGALNVNFADLNLKTLLNIESVTEDDIRRFPDELKSLNGSKIRIRGYMLPTFEETGIDTFFLDHSARAMNFGATPKVYELLEVHLMSGTTTNYVRMDRSIEIVGIFRIEPFVIDGKLERLYLLEDAVVVADKVAPRNP